MKRNDVILICSIFILALAAIVAINLTKSVGEKVVITVDGKEYKVLDLSEDTTFEIEEENGDVNLLEVKNGFVTMKQANCPDRLCVYQNPIHYNGETIVCLPHKVVITIKSAEESDIDASAY